jgi:hypothetical protein
VRAEDIPESEVTPLADEVKIDGAEQLRHRRRIYGVVAHLSTRNEPVAETSVNRPDARAGR